MSSVLTSSQLDRGSLFGYDTESVVLNQIIKDSERWSNADKRWPALETDLDNANPDQFLIRCVACYKKTESAKVGKSRRPTIMLPQCNYSDETYFVGEVNSTTLESESARSRRIKSAPIYRHQFTDKTDDEESPTSVSDEASKHKQSELTARPASAKAAFQLERTRPRKLEEASPDEIATSGSLSRFADRTYFDADSIDLPEYMYKYALPACCKQLKLRSIAERQEDWRNSVPSVAARKLTSLDALLMDRVVELERLTSRTMRAENLQREFLRAKNTAIQKEKEKEKNFYAMPPNYVGNTTTQVGSNCTKGCLQPFCAGECADKRSKVRKVSSNHLTAFAIGPHSTEEIATDRPRGKHSHNVRRYRPTTERRAESSRKDSSISGLAVANQDVSTDSTTFGVTKKRAEGYSEMLRKNDAHDIADLLLYPPGNERHTAYYFFSRITNNRSRQHRPLIGPVKQDPSCSTCTDSRFSSVSLKAQINAHQNTLGIPPICAPTLAFAASQNRSPVSARASGGNKGETSTSRSRKALQLFVPSATVDYSSSLAINPSLMPMLVDKKLLSARPAPNQPSSAVIARGLLTENGLKHGRAAFVFGGQGMPNFPLDTKYDSRRNHAEPASLARLRSVLHLNIK